MAKIAIIGTGAMATRLGQGWAKAGHAIVYGSRDPGGSKVTEQVAGARVTDHASALEGAEIVVIAIPFASVEPFARDHAQALRNRLVIDISNPFDKLPDNRIAAAEITAAAMGTGARVVAAFKDNFSATLPEPIAPQGIVRDVRYAGDNQEDKRTVARLIEDLGFRPLDCGPLKSARVLDGMVTLMLQLDARYANGTQRSGWTFLT